MKKEKKLLKITQTDTTQNKQLNSQYEILLRSLKV